MSATNSGVTPEPGFSYANAFLFYSRDQLKGPSGETLASGQNSVMMDMNSFVWVSAKQIGTLGGARFSMSASFAHRQQLAVFRTFRARSAVGVDTDSYYQPFILGWQEEIRRLPGSLWVPGSHRQIRLHLK